MFGNIAGIGERALSKFLPKAAQAAAESAPEIADSLTDVPSAIRALGPGGTRLAEKAASIPGEVASSGVPIAPDAIINGLELPPSSMRALPVGPPNSGIGGQLALNPGAATEGPFTGAPGNYTYGSTALEAGGAQPLQLGPAQGIPMGPGPTVGGIPMGPGQMSQEQLMKLVDMLTGGGPSQDTLGQIFRSAVR